MSNYWSQQAGQIRGLLGQTVVKVTGLEMALREEGEMGLPVFEEPGVYCRQLDYVQLEMITGEVIAFGTCAGEWSFGICLSPVRDVTSHRREPNDIFRAFVDPEDGYGRIETVDLEVDEEGCITQLTIFFHDREILLVAGEVFEQDGPLVFRKPEESILLFRSADDLHKTVWN